MADPITALAIAGMGATALGGVTQAMGQSYTASAQANMYQYQGGVALVNQQIAKQNADYALKVGEVQAQQQGMRTRAQIGSTKATQGASGLDVKSGSAVDVRESEAELGKYGASVIRSDAAKRAYGYDVEAWQAGTQATQYGMASQTTKTAGKYQVASTLLGTAGSVSSKWMQGYQTGIFK